MNIYPLIRQRAGDPADVVKLSYSSFVKGGLYDVPHGLNTSYFTPVGTVTYSSKPCVIALAPSYSAAVECAVKIPERGLYVQTVADKLFEIDAQIAMARAMKLASVKIARMQAARDSLASQMGDHPGFPLAVLRCVGGGSYQLYTSVRSLAKVFDSAPPLTQPELDGIAANAGGGDLGTAAIEYAKSLRGFEVATKPVDPAMMSWLATLAPAIAAQPFWVMQAAGAHASEVDVLGVLELHMRLVAKLKDLGATMASSDLSDVLVDAVQAIEPSCSSQSIHLAVDWYSGRYPYVGVASKTALVEGVHPALVSAVYPDMSFDGRQIKDTASGALIASVSGSEAWPTDVNVLDEVGRAAFVLEKVLVGITAVLAQDSNVVSPSLLGACGVGYLSPRLYWGVRNV